MDFAGFWIIPFGIIFPISPYIFPIFPICFPIYSLYLPIYFLYIPYIFPIFPIYFPIYSLDFPIYSLYSLYQHLKKFGRPHTTWSPGSTPKEVNENVALGVLVVH